MRIFILCRNETHTGHALLLAGSLKSQIATNFPIEHDNAADFLELGVLFRNEKDMGRAPRTAGTTLLHIHI